MPTLLFDRRLVLQSLAAASLASTAAPLRAQEGARAALLTISDMHAPYARLPALLDTFRRLRDAAGVPTAALINGDIFERGNVVCARSGGAADWAFLSALAAEMPVVVNLGNHEVAVMDDMASFVARADAAGIRVISNLLDTRTGRFFAPVSDRIGLGGLDVSLLGLAATNPFVYRQPARGTLGFLDTASFVADALPGASAGADISVIMSHAGVGPDKTFIDTLPEGTIMQGAHDHVAFEMTHAGVRYLHGGSWGTQVGMLELTASGAGRYTTHTVTPEGGDAALAEAVQAQLSEHLTVEDSAVIAEIPQSYDMHNSILIATEALKAATEADVAMIGHTTFGAPLAAGPLSRYDFNAFVRFGGGIRVAEISGAQLAAIAARANQFAATDLSGRTGDYVHVAALDIDAAATYRLAVNAWTAINQEPYLGTTDLPFEEVEGLELKEIISSHLAATFG
ncbi:MAG: metallophosphoesterase [Pseudomonadota bacterium]